MNLQRPAPILALILSVAAGCDDTPTLVEEHPHEFSLISVKTIDSEEIELVGLNDAGQALWNEDGSGVLWSEGEISLPLLAQDLGEDGQVLGEADGNVVLWEDGAVTNLGPGTAKGLTADGRAFFGTDDGRHFWRHPDGTLEEFTGPLPSLDDALPGQDFVDVHSTTEDGRILSRSPVHMTNTFTPCYVTFEEEVSVIFGINKTCFPVSGENGHLLVNYVGPPGLSSHIESLPHRSEGEGPAWGHDLNASRWIVGVKLASNLPTSGVSPTLFRNDTVFDLNSLVASSSTVIEAAVINNRNEILAIAETDVGGRGIVILRRDRVEEPE